MVSENAWTKALQTWIAKYRLCAESLPADMKIPPSPSEKIYIILNVIEYSQAIKLAVYFLKFRRSLRRLFDFESSTVHYLSFHSSFLHKSHLHTLDFNQVHLLHNLICY
ncbi:hypothetical protein L1987_68113 [Smallanthus sonchifolius]|uniref:Uncharacterized protein n=1 Tax=Smallanthus sonchifolius TaxID=185202 RepID=A0ACB9B3A6_9ASTR|nr:hypothetical protein L1987_68113 [Smallanthus sonchifolius]